MNGNTEYNPIQGDILAFLNEVTKQQKEAQKAAAAEILGEKKEPVSAPIKATTSKSSGLNSEEAFPALGTGIVTPAPAWGNGLPKPVYNPQIISQTFELAYEQQKPLRAEGREKSPRTVASICAEIAKRTHVSIDASTSGKTRSMAFIIRGKPADVAEAKKLLWSEVAQSMTSPIEVPEEHLGAIIGAGGKTLQAIEAETATKINVPGRKDGPYQGYIQISGDFEAILAAKARIQAIVDERSKKIIEKVTLKAHLLPFVFGCSKNKVQEQAQVWSERYSARVSLEIRGEADEASVIFSGDRDNVLPALSEFTRLADEQKQRIRSVSTAITKSLHRFLIGPKGSVLNDLEASTECIIGIPASDNPSDQVTVYGPQEKLFQGLSAILDKTGSMASETIKIPSKVRELLFEKLRSKLNEIQTDKDVSISPCDTGVQVNGIKSQVNTAMAALQALLAPYISWKFDSSLVVDTKYFGHIIGKGGAKIAHLESETGTMLILPSDREEKGAITIAGPTDAAVKAAKAKVSQLVEVLADFLSVELPVESKYHKALIGRNGSNISKYAERHPSVGIFFEGDVAIIKGRTAEVNAVKTELKAEVEALKHDAVLQSYTQAIPVTAEMAKHVIDKKATRPAPWIYTIAAEFDVRVSLESQGEKKSIEIKGFKKMADEACKAIKDHITKLANQGSISLELDHSLHSQIIGKAGKNVKHLDRKYGVNLRFPEASDLENNAITIVGPKDTLEAAKADLLAFYADLKDRQNEEQIVVPSEALPRIIGKGGDSIDAIRIENGVEIDISKEKAETTIIKIRGTVSGIKATVALIQEIVDAVQKEATEDFSISEQHKTILTSTGSFLLARLSDGSSVQAFVPRSGEPRIVVRGERTAVHEIVAKIKELLGSLDSWITVTLPMPARCHGELIGTGGANVQRLQAELKVQLDIPRSNAQEKDAIKVSGLKADVDAALPTLQAYIKEEKKIPVSSRSTRQLVSDKLRREHPSVRVISTRDSLVLQASADQLAQAVASIQLHLANQSSETIEVPKEKHGLLIGPMGSTVKSIREASGADLELPERGSDSTSVIITGSPDAIIKAKSEIERILA